MAKQSGTARIEVVSPVSRIAEPSAMVAPRRLDSLSGKKIALWWNSKARGDVALNTVAELLEKRFPGLSFVHFDQQYDHGRHFPERYGEVKASGADAVIASSGD